MSLADTTLEAIADFSNVRCVALFVREQEQLTLLASRNIEQSLPTTIGQTWANHRAALTQGQLIVESDESGSRAVVPIERGHDNRWSRDHGNRWSTAATKSGATVASLNRI
jgi:hypothetical protein